MWAWIAPAIALVVAVVVRLVSGLLPRRFRVHLWPLAGIAALITLAMQASLWAVALCVGLVVAALVPWWDSRVKGAVAV